MQRKNAEFKKKNFYFLLITITFAIIPVIIVQKITLNNEF